ncbi:MAG: T9SS type A sorting domain-containing protein [Bacteroidetes bacterium]|nr:T9SS type A sorting domain-containing protein [Bacteroidota bacterium]
MIKNILPNSYSISQNYPNPFNPSTIIQYTLPFESNVSIVVYNILGEEVTKLVGGNKPAGIHKIHFNGTGLSSGIYLYSIRATSIKNNKNFLKVKKMVLIK